MSLAAGARLGPYEIQTAIGAGGMGEIYKARDTRLDRTVAIKILSEALTADRAFRERFEREARLISQLDHPNICALYDVGEEQGTSFLVMPFLDGQTLAKRLERGALPLGEALAIAVQIASALDRAHRAGIIHRDLKPGNIVLTKSGAKLLDFGLAKTTSLVSTGAGVSSLPTTAPLTGEGTLLGTFQMKPIAFVVFTMLLALSVAARAQRTTDGSGEDPTLGTWQLNVSKSTYIPGPRPVSQTRTYKKHRFGIEATVRTIYADGRSTTVQSVFDYDKQEHPVTGSEDVDTIVMTRSDTYTYVATLSHAGLEIGAVRREISRDGKQMTVTLQRRTPPTKNLEVYEKVVGE